MPCSGSPRLQAESSKLLLGKKHAQTQTTHAQKGPVGLPDKPCRTRFAPSPTGYLHLGSLRTALFNFLLARATGGQFILRIEDTDQVSSHCVVLTGILVTAGPDKAGPYGPYRQSQRLSLYDQHIDTLLRDGKAYRCFCPPEDLEAHKREAHNLRLPTAYSGKCRSLSADESDERASKGEPYAVRFKSSTAPALVRDLVYGRFKKAVGEEDFIIRKRDGFPSYHLANVVDDKNMGITHVIRGAEWLTSTPKHVELYDAFGWDHPQFAHVGLLTDMQRQKLSKRHEGVDMSWYRDRLIVPAALLNFAVLLGWHKRGSKSEFMTLQDMADSFSLKFTKGDIIVSLDKLFHLQKEHVRHLIDNETPDEALLETYLLGPISTVLEGTEAAKEAVATDSAPAAEADGIDPDLIGELVPALRGAGAEETQRRDYILGLLRISSNTPSTDLAQFVGDNRYAFWEIPQPVLAAAISQAFAGKSLAEGVASAAAAAAAAATANAAVNHLLARLRREDEASWTPAALKPLVDAWCREVSQPAEGGAKSGSEGFKALRWALLAGQHGPPLAALMCLMGKQETVRRLETAALVAAEAAAGR
ncbi:hypothetical protein B0T26DRAFT_643346 [Lasiosphaeria miniovina]|uniref:glutamate--tRNA ligase n=1 Tax=Lasiosphaeria miniovina TaxID=1954250 RepID=A0AA40E3B4_9PEZI|nr:uncharacterized protein B0T26DRAFT_643346 [Lasiosphaeria miniovina]KAK0722541.1 hypothetical protein B0T26DRAFT_643346 [Lasiosphaeria miniovina]